MIRAWMKLAVGIALAIAGFGCRGDTAYISGFGGANVLYEGEVTILRGKLHHPEIEGSTEIPIDKIESKNPTVVQVEPLGDKRFAVWGVAPGSATLHVSGGVASDDVVVQVIAFPEPR